MSAPETPEERLTRAELERRAIERLHSAGLLEWAEYKRVQARYANRWPAARGLLGEVPSHAPDCGCSECPEPPDPKEAA